MAVSDTFHPSYWSAPCYSLEDVPLGTQATLIGIINSSWDPDVVGAGKDAKKLTHSGVEITGVKTVENTTVFQSYIKKKREFEQRGRSCPPIGDISQPLANFNKSERNLAVNEYYLFHGTKEAISIAQTGFQTRFADPNNLFGKGIYFSDSFQKADQYSDDPQHRTPLGTELTVILARVLLGHTSKCSKQDADQLTRLPCTQHPAACICELQQRCDSIESTDLLFKEFAVYDGKQCYPEYIITYRRTGIPQWNIPNQEEPTRGRKKQKKPRSERPKKPRRKKQPVPWQLAIRSVSAAQDGHPLANGITKLTSFCVKTKTALPDFEFHENSGRAEIRWECVCRLHFPVEASTEARGRRKKIAKRLAAELMWQKLKSLLETIHPVLG